MIRYFALIKDINAGTIDVTFPDWPGCSAEGADVEAALLDAISALAMWIAEHGSQARPRIRGYAELIRDQAVLTAISHGASLVSVPYLPEAGGKWVRATYARPSKSRP